MPLRIIFCGTPAFAVPSLRRLNAQSDMEIAGVITQPDRPRGRGQELGVSAVKAAALELKLPVRQPEKIKSEEGFQYVQGAAPDAVVIIAYGQIISQRLIDIPRLGWINLHASLLPRYRGAAPINWAIVNGETETGVTAMQIDAGLDTGPILGRRTLKIGRDETAPQLALRLAEAGAPLVVETLRKLDAGENAATPQDNSRASYAPPLRKEDGRVDWQRSARRIYNQIRGLDPWPGVFTTFRGKTCRIWGRPAEAGPPERPENVAPLGAGRELWDPGAIVDFGGGILVACGEGTLLRLEFAQLEGRKRVTAGEFANGARLTPADHFGS